MARCSQGLQDLVYVALDKSGARVVVFVEPMAEAHERLVAFLHALQKVRNVFGRAYPLEHVVYLNICPAVQRTVERGDAGGDGREGVGTAGANGAYRRRR